MLRRNSRAYRLTIALIACGLLGGVVYAGYYFYSRSEAATDSMRAAEEAYRRGREALDAQEGPRAVAALDEANGLMEKANLVLEDERKNTKMPTPDKEREWNDREGKLYWLRSQILRDGAFASALAEGKPIAETDDFLTQEKFRSFLAIPSAEVRINAVRALRQAAQRLPQDLQVQQDVLRVELLQPESTWNWTSIERMAKRVKELDPDNIRARYYLAKGEFEQYQETRFTNEKNETLTGFAPTPESKRSRERVESALENLQAVKKSRNNPIWRTAYLESQINRWLYKNAPNSARDKAREYDAQYRELLFNKDYGALPRAERKEGFTTLSSVDYRGVVGLHVEAVEYGIEQSRVSMGGETKTLFEALKALATLADNLWNLPQGASWRPELFEINMQMASKARRVLGSDPPDGWAVVRDHLEQLARLASEANVSRPLAYALLAQLLNNEAFLEAKKGNISVKKDLDARAKKWVEEGLKQARENKTPLPEQVELNGVAVETAISRGGDMNELTPLLEALRKISNEPRAAAILGVQEAVILVRRGKFARAQALLEEVLKNPRLDELRPRALTLMAYIQLATKNSTDALRTLAELQKSYVRAEELNPIERAWMLEFLRDPQDIALLTITAELDTAAQKFDRYQAEKPNTPIDQTTSLAIESHVQKAGKALKTLQVGKDAELQARVKFALFYLRTGQIENAIDTVKALKAMYPNSVEVLRLEVALALLPDATVREGNDTFAQRVKRGDALIQSFLTTHATDIAAKRFWGEWLIRTNRSAEALEYLRGLKSGSDEKDTALERMLAVALLKKGQVDEGSKLIQSLAMQLPNDRSLELLLILTTANPVVRQKLLEDAAKNPENNGLVRMLRAESLLREDKPREAAQIYWETSEHIRVKDAARAGFLRAALRLASEQPDAALTLVEELMQESPKEAMLYAIAAYAKLKREEFGSPADVWDRNKTMYGALKVWGSLAAQSSMDSGEIAAFRAQFWSMANRADLAWAELEPLASLKKDNVLLALIDLAITSGDDDKLAKAMNYLALLKETNPKNLNLILLQGRLMARTGNLAGATETLERLIEREPRFLAAYPFLIKVLNDRQQADKAAVWNQHWLKLSPNDPLANMEVIRQKLAIGNVKTAHDESEAYLITAEDRVRSNLPKTTNPDLQKTQEESVQATRHSALILLGQTWMLAGDFKGADEYLNRCLKEDPKNLSALVLKAQCLLGLKDYAKAKDAYEQLLKDHPNNFIAKTNLAWILAEHLDQPSEALKLVREELQSPFTGKPMQVERLAPEFLNTLGSVMVAAAKKQVEKNLYEEMKVIFERASQRYPSDPLIYMHLGQAYAGCAQNDLAGNAYQTALKLLENGKGSFSPVERKEIIQKTTQRMKEL